ncbi:hypothetical protein GCM10009844_22570 [Nocardioides koreensis]|uniref:MarR family transcriptional regulator n=1 Tax=Nocardioides koreensis TaxID=433651 RepID=A0ABN2ZRS1_9ACTN
MTTEMLPDRWRSRDLLVLLEAARQADAGEDPDTAAMAGAAGIDRDAVDKVLVALENAGYVQTRRGAARAGGPGTLWEIEILERGRRATGLWPNGDTAVEQLLDALRQAEELADDPDDKSALRKAGGQLASVSRSVLAEVIAAVVTRQAGL